jgi:hypothetical protein
MAPERLALAGGIGQARDVEVLGDFAFVGALDTLVVLDVSDLAHPSPVTTLDFHPYGIVTDLELVGHLLYVADMSGRLRIFDIADPSNPKLVGVDQLAGDITDVEVVGSLAYSVDSRPWAGGLLISDVSDCCPSDLDDSGLTDVFDFGIFAASYRATVSPGSRGDLDRDGVVTASDFTLFTNAFGCRPESGAR